jgi:hypothetical protein
MSEPTASLNPQFFQMRRTVEAIAVRGERGRL